MRLKSAILSLLIIAVAPATTYAGKKDKDMDAGGKVIAGWIEKVTVPLIRDEPIKAKLDSGANTSSIHAIDVEQFEQDGDDWVRFTFVDKDGAKKELERAMVRGVKIKDLGGGADRRPVIELDMCFDGRVHKTQFTLSDRSGFNYRILLGRRFMKGVAVIDPDETYLTKDHCRDATADKDD
ncbi:ATP-dependent zinc protease [Litorivivens sp.]|uniref:ATP-dependent zinc protease family protein n=1 Tax=Litorivivens sp. TaxID=2020868 RepID=UPI003568FB1C